MVTRTITYGTFIGYGQTRKTKKSAQREADAWEASGDGVRHVVPAMHGRPSYVESCSAEAEIVEGGFACAYYTVREPLTVGDVQGAAS